MNRAVEDLISLLQIPGPPGKEGAVSDFLIEELLQLGLAKTQLTNDEAHRQSEYGGQVGNLIVRLEGNGPGPHLMFSAHMDTVPEAVGCQPRIDSEQNRIVNDVANHALGGDNRSGCAVLLSLVRKLREKGEDHPLITLVFFVQEEVGLIGSRGLDVSLLGESKPAMCFNFDGATPDKVITRVIGTERFTIRINGTAAHAGANPDGGVSAAIIAAHAISQLDSDGWHGRIIKEDGQGTANVGVLKGGQGSNVTMPSLEILAESRSHHADFRRRIIATWKEVFRKAAERVTNRQGQSGSVRFSKGPTYDAFALDDSEAVVQIAVEAARTIGLESQGASDDGGMDANWIVAHGIPTVTLGSGQRRIHTADEWIDLGDFMKACELVEAIVDTASLAGS